MRRQHEVRPGSRILFLLTALTLLVAPAAGFDLDAEPGSTDPSCCCAPEETPPPSCCDEPEPAAPATKTLFVSDMDCACRAPSPPAPNHPVPAPHGASAQLSSELQNRVHVAAETPSVFQAADAGLLGAVVPPPIDALNADLSVLHRRSARGTSVVLAFLSVARI